MYAYSKCICLIFHITYLQLSANSFLRTRKLSANASNQSVGVPKYLLALKTVSKWYVRIPLILH